MGVSISKTVAATDDTTELVQLHIFVEESDWWGTFNQVEVWRSRGLSTGPYEELTADRWLSARLPKDAGDQPASPVTGRSVVVVGLDLQLRINETDDLVIVFTGTDPLTLSEAASQIQAQSATRLRSYVDEDGVLVIETVEPGTGAALRVVGGDAVSELQLPTQEPYSLAYGRDSRIQLIKDKEKYTFNDIRGDSTYFYRTRFRDSVTGSHSEYSIPSPADHSLGVSAQNVVSGVLSLVQLDGKPLRGLRVRILNRFKTQQIESKLVAGPEFEALTDMDGKVEFMLVRGAEITVSIDGTDIVRDVTVPTDPAVEIFNLLDPTVSVDDIFTVRTPTITYAQARSLQ